LPGKHLIVSEIVSDAGQHRSHPRSGKRWQGAAVAVVAADEFLGEMHGVGSAAAIAAR